MNVFWHGQGLAIPPHLGLFSVCTFLTKCLVFFQSICAPLQLPNRSPAVANALANAWSLSFICPDFVGCAAFVSSSLLLLWWAFSRVWGTVSVNSGDCSAFCWETPSSEAEETSEGICRKYSSWCWFGTINTQTVGFFSPDSLMLIRVHRHSDLLTPRTCCPPCLVYPVRISPGRRLQMETFTPCTMEQWPEIPSSRSFHVVASSSLTMFLSEGPLLAHPLSLFSHPKCYFSGCAHLVSLCCPGKCCCTFCVSWLLSQHPKN